MEASYNAECKGILPHTVYDIRVQTKVAGHNGADIRVKGHKGTRTEGRRDVNLNLR